MTLLVWHSEKLAGKEQSSGPRDGTTLGIGRRAVLRPRIKKWSFLSTPTSHLTKLGLLLHIPRKKALNL